jgi:hypothetical protein
LKLRPASHGNSGMGRRDPLPRLSDLTAQKRSVAA